MSATTTRTAAAAIKKDPVLAQLKRTQGQIGGVIKMYEADRPCVDIVRQIVATRNSLGRTAREFLTSEVDRCSREKKPRELEAILTELFR